MCAALDTLLLQWGARRREDYHNLYIEISEGQLSIEIEDGKTLVIDSDGSLTLREVNGTMHYKQKNNRPILENFGIILKLEVALLRNNTTSVSKVATPTIEKTGRL